MLKPVGGRETRCQDCLDSRICNSVMICYILLANVTLVALLVIQANVYLKAKGCGPHC